mmetsp:Transcript_11106/g.41481  ORF Transcript_11106/g.41481 Transcript_11106/m.41481 type:complete len:462 (-) Transcript_11106:67-1452(-)
MAEAHQPLRSARALHEAAAGACQLGAGRGSQIVLIHENGLLDDRPIDPLIPEIPILRIAQIEDQLCQEEEPDAGQRPHDVQEIGGVLAEVDVDQANKAHADAATEHGGIAHENIGVAQGLHGCLGDVVAHDELRRDDAQQQANADLESRRQQVDVPSVRSAEQEDEPGQDDAAAHGSKDVPKVPVTLPLDENHDVDGRVHLGSGACRGRSFVRLHQSPYDVPLVLALCLYCALILVRQQLDIIRGQLLRLDDDVQVVEVEGVVDDTVHALLQRDAPQILPALLHRSLRRVDHANAAPFLLEKDLIGDVQGRVEPQVFPVQNISVGEFPFDGGIRPAEEHFEAHLELSMDMVDPPDVLDLEANENDGLEAHDGRQRPAFLRVKRPLEQTEPAVGLVRALLVGGKVHVVEHVFGSRAKDVRQRDVSVHSGPKPLSVDTQSTPLLSGVSTPKILQRPPQARAAA